MPAAATHAAMRWNVMGSPGVERVARALSRKDSAARRFVPVPEKRRGAGSARRIGLHLPGIPSSGAAVLPPSEIVVDAYRVLLDVLAEVRLLRAAAVVRGEVVLQPLRHEEEIRALGEVIRRAHRHLRAAEAIGHANRAQARAFARRRLHIVDLRAPLLAPARVPNCDVGIVLVAGGASRRERVFLPLLAVRVELELVDAPRDLEHDFRRLVLRARESIAVVAHRRGDVRREAEEVVVNLVAHGNLEGAARPLDASRPEVRLAEGRVGLRRRVLQLALEAAPLRRFPIDDVLRALVEAADVARSEAQVAVQVAGGGEVAAGDAEERNVVRIALEGRIHAAELDGAPGRMREADERIALREATGVAIEKEDGPQLEDGLQATAELLASAHA